MSSRTISHALQSGPISDELKPELFNKTVRDIPVRLKKEFEILKNSGNIHGSLNSYIVYALAQQLKRDK